MRLLKALLIFRPVNLMILAVTQYCVYTFLRTSSDEPDGYFMIFVQIVIASVLMAMAGNVHNDLVDVEPDKINKPGRNYSTYWRNRWMLWIVYVILSVLSILIPGMILINLGVIFFILNILLFIYNFQLKKLPVAGNLLISGLVGFSLLIIGLVVPDIEYDLLLFYSGFAFLMTLIRELVKDAEDIQGDRASGYATLPVLIGERRTNRVIGNVSIFAVVLLVVIVYEGIGIWLTGWRELIASVYALVCIVLPLMYIVLKVTTGNNVQYRELSGLLKYVMVTGIASMLFF